MSAPKSSRSNTTPPTGSRLWKFIGGIGGITMLLGMTNAILGGLNEERRREAETAARAASTAAAPRAETHPTATPAAPPMERMQEQREPLTTEAVALTAPEAPAARPQSPAERLDAALSSAERQQLWRTMQFVLDNDELPAPREHRDFWRLLTRGESLTTADLDELFGYVAEPHLGFRRTFFEDALSSLFERRPVRSAARAEIEDAFLRYGAVSERVLALRAEQMSKIARREPIDLGRVVVVMDENALARRLSALDADAQRLRTLFRPAP